MANTAGEWSAQYGQDATWKIPKFFDLFGREDYYVTSPASRLANATWYLKLVFDGDTFDGGRIWIGLIRSQSSVPEHLIHCKIGLKTCTGNEHFSQSGERTFGKDKQGILAYGYRFSQIIDERRLLLPDGALTVICQIRVTEGATAEASSLLQLNRNEPPPKEVQEAFTQTEVPELVNQTEEEKEEASTSVQKLQSDYSALLKSEEDSDVCLKVSDKEFRAHRCILRARSTVFSAMFKHDTEEKASGEVVIEDLDPGSFSDFLQHVYTGCVDGLSDDNVFDLYVSADKYDMQELKSECRDYMKRTLSVDTFCDVMTLALRHREEELLKLAIEFFSKNLTKIIVTVKWQTFSKDHNTEANELFIKALVPAENSESL